MPNFKRRHLEIMLSPSARFGSQRFGSAGDPFEQLFWVRVEANYLIGLAVVLDLATGVLLIREDGSAE